MCKIFAIVVSFNQFTHQNDNQSHQGLLSNVTYTGFQFQKEETTWDIDFQKLKTYLE